MMKTRINMVSLFVENMQTIVSFYRDVLGFPAEWDVEDPYVEFDNDGVRFSFFKREKIAELFGRTPAFPDGLNGTFELAIDFPTPAEAESFYAEAVRRGAEPIYAPRIEPWHMLSSMIADPEKNLIEITSWNLPSQ